MTDVDSAFVEPLRAFVASPGDVGRERDHTSAVADELNRGVAKDAGFVLEVVRWETHARPDMGRPQQLIFDQIGSVDIFIGIMWHRFGTPSGVAGSGTEEEFEQALQCWEQTGRPRMLCYFSEAPIKPPRTVEEASQLLKVAEFRKRVEQAGLAWTYSSDLEFKDRLREHLQRILVREFAGRRPPIDRNLAALLEIEKERCRERNVMFLTPNLLFSLFSTPESPMRRILDQACPDMADTIVESLRDFEPRNAPSHSTSFIDFDWYDRDDIQAARRRARQEGNPAIDARHLFLGFLDVQSETKTELRRALGDESFGRLQQMAETANQIVGTPGVDGIFNKPRGTASDDG